MSLWMAFAVATLASPAFLPVPIGAAQDVVPNPDFDSPVDPRGLQSEVGQPAAVHHTAESAEWRVFRDPGTGELVDPPASPPLAGPAGVAPKATLVERPSPARAGGMVIDLGDRFQSASTVTRDASGMLSVECVTPGTRQTTADTGGGR